MKKIYVGFMAITMLGLLLLIGCERNNKNLQYAFEDSAQAEDRLIYSHCKSMQEITGKLSEDCKLFLNGVFKEFTDVTISNGIFNNSLYLYIGKANTEPIVIKYNKIEPDIFS